MIKLNRSDETGGPSPFRYNVSAESDSHLSSGIGSQKTPEASAYGLENAPEASVYGSGNTPEASAYGSGGADLTGYSSSIMADGLDASQQQRLVGILDEYMIAVEEGKNPCIDAIALANPDLEHPLREYLKGLDWLREMKLEMSNDSASRGVRLDLRQPSSYESFRMASKPNELGGYELGKELGRGAMGVVYEATSKANGSKVAVKVLAFGSIAGPQRLERFRREAMVTDSLQHPNIVRVIEAGVDKGVPFYAMTLILGKSLANYDRQSMDYQSLAGHFAEIAEALHVAHQSGVIHRDIKPSNLLLDANRKIWITDFGLAFIDDGRDLTQTGDLVGTFHYMSPEQASGHPERVDRRTDVYSLGATLYEILSGRPPFHGLQGTELLKQIQSSEPKRLKLLDSDLPRDFETIVRRAMRPEKSDRYATAKELASDLKRFSQGKRIHATRVTVSERIVRWTANHAAMVSIGFVVSLLCTIGIAGLCWMIQLEKGRTQLALLRADRNYENARQVVDHMGLQVAEKLKSLPGSESIRTELMAESLAYYQAFIADANKDDRLAKDVAHTHLKIARLIAQSGSIVDADRAYQAATQSLEVASAADPREQIVLLWIQSLNEWSLVESQQGNHAKARDHLLEALKCLLLLPEGNARNVAEAISLNSMAVVEMNSKDVRSAIEYSARSVQLIRSLDQNKSESGFQQELKGTLADSLMNFSSMIAESDKSAKSAAFASELAAHSIELRGSITSTNRSPDQLRRTALAYNNLAALQWRASKVDSAIENYQQGIKLLEQTSQQLPGQSGPQRELAVTLNNLGMALTSSKKYRDAEEVFRRAIAIATQAADSDPSNVDAAKRAAGIWNNLGVLLRNQNEVRQAYTAFESARKYQSSICKLDPNSLSHSTTLAQIESNLKSLSK